MMKENVCFTIPTDSIDIKTLKAIVLGKVGTKPKNWGNAVLYLYTVFDH